MIKSIRSLLQRQRIWNFGKYLCSASCGHCFVDIQKLNYGADRNTPVSAPFTKLRAWPSVCVVPPDSLSLTDIKSPRTEVAFLQFSTRPKYTQVEPFRLVLFKRGAYWWPDNVPTKFAAVRSTYVGIGAPLEKQRKSCSQSSTSNSAADWSISLKFST